MPKDNLIDIEPQHLAIVKQVLETYLKGKQVWAYGSRVKWNANQYSDLDLVVFDASVNQLSEGEDAFEESIIPYKISLLRWEKLPENFQSNILEKYVVVQEYAKEREWREISLEEITEPIKDTYLPTGSDNLNYIGLEHIEQETLRLNGVGKSTDVTSNKFKFNKGDVLFGKLRPYFRKVAKPDFSGICSTDIWVLRAKGDVNQDFLFYFISNWDFINLSNGGEGGTRMPRADWNFLKQTRWNIPNTSEQRAIAGILSSLDDKIDLLNRQNATLEKMAETLFRQWFVEEAKEEWKVGKLSDLVIVKYGKDHKKLLDGTIPVYGSGGLMRYVDKSLYDKESVLIPRKGTLNNVMYQDEPFWTVDTMFYTEMKNPNVAKFVYHFLREQDLASMNVGSAVPSMTTEILNNMPLDIPPKDVFEKFEGAVAPLYVKIKTNQTQIRTLTTLRDTLLPKLMSGEVRVGV